MDLENYHKKFEELPEGIQDALLSPSTAEAIYNIGKSNNLPDEKISLLAELVGDIFIDSSQEANLVNLVKKLGLDSQAATEVTKNLLEKVINPIKSSVSSDSQLKIAEEVAPLRPIFAKEPPIIPQGSETTTKIPTPQAQPPQEEQIAHEAPFILHKEEEVEPTKEASQYSIKRPEFYKPTFSEEYKRSKQAESAARIELGEEIKEVQPRMERTSAQPSRIVHYSQFKTPLDFPEGALETQKPSEPTSPSKPATDEEKKKDVKPSEIHPNNIIDLKDLPLE